MEIFISIRIVFNIIKGPSFMEQAWGPHVLIFDIWDDMFTINLMLNSIQHQINCEHIISILWDLEGMCMQTLFTQMFPKNIIINYLM